MRSVIGDLVWRVTGDTKDVDSKLKATDQNVDKVGKSFSGAGKAAVAAMAVAAVIAVAKVSKELVKAASTAEETNNKFNVTFSSLIEYAEDSAKALAEGFGLSSNAAKQLLADTGDLLSGFGFTQKEAFDLSKQVNELAVDLASFTNFAGGAEGASAALTKGLLGEREAMKSLGIAIMEADIKQLAEDKGITGTLDRQTKAMLTLELAIQQSKNAIGDFERSSDSFANQQRVAKAAVDDLKVALGERLLPAATDSISAFAGLTRRVADFIAERNKLKNAEEAVDTGVDTIEQRILLTNNEIELIKKRLAVNEKEYTQRAAAVKDEAARAEFINNALKADRDLLQNKQNSIGYLEQLLRQEQLITEQEQKRQAALDAETALNEDRAKSLKEYLDLVAGEYEKTKQGQIEQLQQEIALWERYAETAVSTAPQVAAILEDRRAKLDELLGVEEETAENAEQVWEDYYNALEQKRAEDLRNALESTTLQRQYSELFFSTLLSGFSALGEELVKGELSWNSFAKVGLNAIAALLDAIGAQLAAMAALAFVQSVTGLNLGASVGVGPAALASAGAYTAAGVVRGFAGSFEQGGVVPYPAGVSPVGDKVLVATDPGEVITPADEAKGQYIFEFQFDSNVFARAVVDNINKGRNIINASRGVR